MKSIEVRKINKIDNTISYDFLVSNELSCFFSGKEFRIEYPENIENVPDSVAVIPFVCNVLPIIWLTDSQLVIKEIDRDFYESIPNFKKGYETMFPESKFLGEIIVSEIVDCTYQSEEKCAAFFSGGLDAVQTLVSHLEENPTLISVWGSDIQYENTDGWSKVYSLT